MKAECVLNKETRVTLHTGHRTKTKHTHIHTHTSRLRTIQSTMT
jgi:hypothetical protein